MASDKPAAVRLFLGELQSILWKLTWDHKPDVTRLLDTQQVEAAKALHDALDDTILRLLKEAKPKRWRKGQRVRVLKRISVIRSASPLPGTIGRVNRVFQNEYGWWVVLDFSEEFCDCDGTIWYPDASNPMGIWFKEDEIEPAGRLRKTP